MEKDQCKRQHQATGAISRLSRQKSTSIWEIRDKAEALLVLQRDGLQLQQQVESAGAETQERFVALLTYKGLY